ncbi:DUF4238 domain-containing protein [Methylovorus mays]|uniref:DUF4238 domain-containing protein n=1 Tax=Methylovorus mays TaxID=184077 RepID=UPI001E5372DE|nr:DUF4238 domain-containing protein [Methylovorus mays]MCB5207344.1 DUF4238 domain-containing protein [Methylovorus mays]
MQQTKRHHYVPKTYLNSFCDKEGKLLVYRKDGPSEPLKVTPDNTQFRRYYYSQPIQDGGQDNNTLEALFSAVESYWPATVNALKHRSDVNSRIESIIQFICLQRVRVPACRDMVEAIEAQFVKDTLITMLANGQLPPLPPELADLPNKLKISIDPHRSIHRMVDMLRAMGNLIDKLGFVVIHNKTKRPFLTSDNPVLWFDPTLPFLEQKPYTINPQGPILLFFPVSPDMGLLGTSGDLERFQCFGFEHQENSDEEWVEIMNAQICRFAYEAVIASASGQEYIIECFKDVSPVHEASSLRTKTGNLTIHKLAFDKRVQKQKWNPNNK